MTDANKAALEALEKLANTPMQLSMGEWNDICTAIRRALTTPAALGRIRGEG